MNDAYVNKKYKDGDKDIYLPPWRRLLQQEATNFNEVNLSVEMQKLVVIGENEIALKHPVTGATIKLMNDGGIEMFVNADTGMRMDPRDNSIVFYGDSVHIATKETRLHTKPHGLIWNNHNFNPHFYHGEGEAGSRNLPKVKSRSNGEERELPLFQEQQRKQYYDPAISDMIERLGIESPRQKRKGDRT